MCLRLLWILLWIFLVWLFVMLVVFCRSFLVLVISVWNLVNSLFFVVFVVVLWGMMSFFGYGVCFF